MNDFYSLTPEEVKNKSRGHSSDMSPEAIYRRLQILGELHEFGFFLKKLKPVMKTQPLENHDPQS